MPVVRIYGFVHNMEFTRRDNKEGSVSENLETGFWYFVDHSVYLCFFWVNHYSRGIDHATL